MIEFLLELFGTGLVYDFFARRRAAGRRKRYDGGTTVSFAGFVGGAFAPADIQEVGRGLSLCASRTGFWIETNWPLTPQRREIPRPERAAQIESAASQSRPKPWYEVPAARYMSSKGIIEIYCERPDLELLRQVLCDRAMDSKSSDQ